MRTSRLLFGLLALTAPLFAVAADPEPPAAAPNPSDGEATEPPGTYFNGKFVPAMSSLSGETLETDIAEGYWFVKFYSPYCKHCKALAPIWQTLYEYYYTSKPVTGSQQSSGEHLNSFSRYYDFKFAEVDCVAFGTVCGDRGIHSFPTLIIFKDGKEVKKQVGALEIDELSAWVEPILETIRPGSRPVGGPLLPAVGANSVDTSKKTDVPVPKEKEAEAAVVVTEAQATRAPSTASAASLIAATASSKAKQSIVPNPEGSSVPLTAASFQRLVTNTMDPWFVKFYAPWCGHCKALAPNWKEMAREMEGVLNVGEVNCDIEKRLCKDARVKGYPTMLFFRGGERVEYDGLRGVGDLISYAKKATDVGGGVKDVDAAAFEKLEETEEVIFLYFYDHATVSEDFAALERLTLSLIGHAKLVKTKDPKLAERFKISTWPRLVVSRDGTPSYYPYIAPKDMRDYRKILTWMQSVWLPIVPELTASNANEIMNGKYVVLGILSRTRSDEFVIAKREIKNAALEWIDKDTHARQLERQELRDAKQLRIEEAEDRNDQRALRAAKQIRISIEDSQRPQVTFAWVDGVFWERWIRTTYGIDVSQDGERVVINDEDNRRYWDTTSTGNPIVPSRTSILETIPKVIALPAKIAPKSSTSRLMRVVLAVRNAWTRHPWGALGVALGLCLGAFAAARRYRRRVAQFGAAGFFNLDREKGSFGGLLGVGGGAPNGKVD